MNSILITGVASDSGKTTFTMGFLKLLKLKGIDVGSFKVGPDYIDPMFHKHITGENCYNLPAWMVTEDDLKYLYYKRAKEKGVNVIEGVMGYFDGRSFEDYEGSSAQIAELLDVPVLLLVDGSKTALTAAAIVKGLKEFAQVNQIKGVVFNKVNTPKHYGLLKNSVEKHTGIKCYGYLPLLKEASVKSRHLGLIQAFEIEDLDEKVTQIALQIEETVEWELLLEAFKHDTCVPSMERPMLDRLKERVEEVGGLTIGVAKDRAFAFYYEENLKLLEEIGVSLRYFSPINDSELPKDIDGLYLGGGYPEVFAGDLENNLAMRKAIFDFAGEEGPIYAECGGLMYLSRSISQVSGASHEMVGVFDGEAKMTSRLQHFGFVETHLNLWGKEWVYKAHEFHKSKIEGYTGAYAMTVHRNEQTWPCGYFKKSVLATYSHNHFYSNLDFLNFLISFWSKRK